MIDNTAETGNSVAQGQTVTCCEGGSIVLHLCKVSLREDDCSTRDLQQGQATCNSRFYLVSEGMNGAEIHRKLAAKYGQNCFTQRSVYDGSKCLKAADQCC
jgi:hypothetical protein